MGGNLLRRKAVMHNAARARACMGSSRCSSRRALPRGRSRRRWPPPSSRRRRTRRSCSRATCTPAGALQTDTPSAAAPTDDGDLPLPPLQGHESPEVSSIPIPDENIIDRYVDGLLATRMDWLQAVLDRSMRYRRAHHPRDLQQGAAARAQVPAGPRVGVPGARHVPPRRFRVCGSSCATRRRRTGCAWIVWLDERRDVRKATEASLGKLAGELRDFRRLVPGAGRVQLRRGKALGGPATQPGQRLLGLEEEGSAPTGNGGVRPPVPRPVPHSRPRRPLRAGPGVGPPAGVERDRAGPVRGPADPVTHHRGTPGCSPVRQPRAELRRHPAGSVRVRAEGPRGLPGRRRGGPPGHGYPPAGVQGPRRGAGRHPVGNVRTLRGQRPAHPGVQSRDFPRALRIGARVLIPVFPPRSSG